MIVLRPSPIAFRPTNAPRVHVDDFFAEVVLDSFTVRFRRIANGDLVGGDITIDAPIQDEFAIGSDVLDQLRALAVALLEQKINPDTIRCPDCRAILSIPIAPHPRTVAEVLCGPKHEVRFDDGSAFVST